MAPPKVFASYSHDSDEHKEWVLKLCTKLVENGVDVTLDEWDLNLGDLMHPFMREGITDSDRVLVICTDRYVQRANTLKGGVGYEINIVDSELDQDLRTNKFIPIVRQSMGKPKIPMSLGMRIYIDFRNDQDFQENFGKLLRAIRGESLHSKPPLGKSSFAKQPSASEKSNHWLSEIPERVESASDTYNLATQLARSGDILGWDQLIERICPNVFQSLVQWRQEELDKQRAENTEQRHEIMDKAVDIVSPLISMALAGVESPNKHFNNQGSLLDDFLNIQNMEGWNHVGYKPWIEIPYALGYVYHNLHGSLCLHINRLDLAFSLAQSKFPATTDSQFTRSVWENYKLMGSCKSLGGYWESWKYLANTFKRWDWLSLIFKNELEYRISLSAYHMALGIHELATVIASGKKKELKEYHPGVDFYFLTEKTKIKQRALSLLVDNSELSELWTCVGVTQMQVEDLWEAWIKLHKSSYWLSNSAEAPPEVVNFFDRVY